MDREHLSRSPGRADHRTDGATRGSGVAGRRTLVEMVQQRAAATEPTDAPDAVKAAAARGTSGSAVTLPHVDRIQRLFGRHDVSGVRAHVGGSAAEGAAAMGAQAYATGDQVAFAAAPDLHTAAHEAAHVVQQRGGVQLKGGIGKQGDHYEQHADAVADRVVAGESAEALLDIHAGSGGAGAGTGRSVQRQLRYSGMPGVYDDTRGHGYGFAHEGGNRYRLFDTGVVYNYNATTRQYVDDNGTHFDAATMNLFMAKGNGWYTRADGTQGYYYYGNYHYVLWQPQQPVLQVQQPLSTQPTQTTKPMSMSTSLSMQQPQSISNVVASSHVSTDLHSNSYSMSQPSLLNASPSQSLHTPSFSQPQYPMSTSLSQTPSMYSPHGFGGSLSQPSPYSSSSPYGSHSQPSAPPRKWRYEGWWISDDGYEYFPSQKSQALRRNSKPVDDPSIEKEVEALELARKKSRQSSMSGVRFMAGHQKASVDDYIREHYNVAVTGTMITLTTLEGDVAGTITWYDFNNKLSFDVSKKGGVDGDHKGIGSMLIYWLMKHGNTGYTEAQIEAFDSGHGVEKLKAWYMRHGFNAGMSGYVQEIADAAEREVRTVMK